MTDVVIVEAVRTPIGRRGGGLSGVHAADLLGHALTACVERAGVEPAELDQVVGGCVTAIGEQAVNVTRTAWLAAGLPLEVAASTVDAQCGSSQHATNVAAGLIASGAADAVIACGVESMTRIPIGRNAAGPGSITPDSYLSRYEPTSQFEGAERIARKWGITREDTDAFGLRSQQRARAAWAAGYFEPEVVPVEAPDLQPVADDDPAAADVTLRSAAATTHLVQRDEGIRETSLEQLAALKPVLGEGGIHTAGSASQISDGAAALLLMSAAAAVRAGLRPRARIVAQCLVGVDPETMLTGPIDATRKLEAKTGLSVSEMETLEINEAFASVVLAWQRELDLDDAAMERVNPNGGAIALGHPLGCSGARLVTTALHTLERIHGRYGLVTMCCGGGLGTGTILERL